MVVTLLGQQYNVGEKSTVILYTYTKSPCRDTRQTPKTKQKQCNSTSSYMVVIIYCYTADSAICDDHTYIPGRL